MKKILLMGASGAGKSTLADALGKRTGYPVLHLDVISHDDTWARLPAEVVEPQILSFLEKNDSWIIDGQYGKFCYKERLDAADVIIFLDMPTLQSLYRCLRRKYRTDKGTEQRFGVKGSQPSALRMRFIHYLVWRYPRQVRRPTLKHLRSAYPEKLRILKTPAAIAAFAEEVYTAL